VDLQADATSLFDAVVCFGVINRLEAVDREANAFAFGADHVIVPIVALQNFVQFVEVRAGENLSPPRFVVKRAPVVLPHVGLITDHFVVVRNSFGAELDSGVGSGRIAEQFDFQPQLEIAVFLRRAEEFVARDILFQRPAGDCAALDSEEAQIAFPAFERFPVEQSLRAALICASGYQQKREKNDRERQDEFTTRRSDHNHLSSVSARQARWYFSMRAKSFDVISPMRLTFMLSSRSAIFTWRAIALV